MVDVFLVLGGEEMGRGVGSFVGVLMMMEEGRRRDGKTNYTSCVFGLYSDAYCTY